MKYSVCVCTQVRANACVHVGANRSFENVANFTCLGMTVTNQNFVHEEIESKLNIGNVFNHLVQNLVSKNVKIEVYRTVSFPLVMYM
jgi:hypothetical protein